LSQKTTRAGSSAQKISNTGLRGGRGKSYKNSFFNPIIQNKVHLKWLSYYLNQYTPNLYSYIVFGNDCQLKEIHLKSDRHKVIQTWQVIGAIDRQACQSPVYLSPEQIDDLYRMLLPLTKRKQVIKERHINSIAQNKQRREAEKICPRCQHGLVLRTAGNFGAAPTSQDAALLKNTKSLSAVRPLHKHLILNSLSCKT